MMIQENCVVSFHYTLKDKTGNVLDQSEGQEPLYYLHGRKNIIQGLEKELAGKTENDEFDVVISPEDGYGDRQDVLVTKVSKEELSGIPDLEVGHKLQAETSEGVQIFTVVEMGDEEVTLDGNHPLAGQELHFEVKVQSVREATEEEISHGHVHGPGGVHH